VSFVAKTPKPPFYVVVFTSVNTPDVDHTEHTRMYHRLAKIAQGYEGYLGIEPARSADGSGSPPFIGRTSNRSRHSGATPSTSSQRRRAASPGIRTT
jgi:hypothetical protein